MCVLVRVLSSGARLSAFLVARQRTGQRIGTAGDLRLTRLGSGRARDARDADARAGTPGGWR